MTIRQFLSILINAGIFGNFGAVSLEGWCGVGWVASGIWIKITKRYDPPKQTRQTDGNKEEYEGLVGGSADPARATPGSKLGTCKYGRLVSTGPSC